ncbi:MAG: hypothetical protein JWM11_1157 [Planctomycetaceae bacterium]|nr:hypothetical protein [Planctomycetaceae bacterium]
MVDWRIVCGFVLVTLLSLAVLYICLIRPWHLRWGATDVEVAETLPGDDLVQGSKGEATHAITIRASAAEIWPWLIQLGQDRAGFYSYTWLENLFGCHMKNTYQIVPEWQHLKVGDGVLFTPQFPRIPVAVLEPNRALVIGGTVNAKTGQPIQGGQVDLDTSLSTSWAFVLHEHGEHQTRLIARLRGRFPRGLLPWLVNRLFWEPAHFIMERRMLLTIKRLAEASRTSKTRLELDLLPQDQPQVQLEVPRSACDTPRMETNV